MVGVACQSATGNFTCLAQTNDLKDVLRPCPPAILLPGPVTEYRWIDLVANV